MTSWRELLPNRRWLQIQLRTVFFLATALCVYLAWPHLMRQYAFWRLCQYGDREFSDLWAIEREDFYNLVPKSSETGEIQALIKQMLPPRSRFEEIFFYGKPWIIQSVKNSRARLMIVVVTQPFSIPGSGDVRIVLFDRVGRIIGDKTISTGNRFFPRTVACETTTRDFTCLIVDSKYFWVGWTQRQYIAMRDNRMRRCERLTSL
jgi:hypothetical protein